MKYNLSIGDDHFEVEVGEIREDMADVLVNGTSYKVHVEKPVAGRSSPVSAPAPSQVRPAVAPVVKPAATPVRSESVAGGTPLPAPISGLILDIKVNVGDAVEAGQIVVVLEAMKMENRLSSPASGKVKEIRVQKGAQVSTGDVLLIIG